MASLTQKRIRFPYLPQTRQKLFHYSTTDPKYWADEVLYGGAAGGGKSAAIVGDAFKNAMKYAGINILVLRRTLPELEGSILLKMLEWYPREVCRYKEQKKIWEFTNGSRIWLGYCEQENDVYRYQGKEFEIIYMDEATHFSYTQFKYLKSRNRTANQAAIEAGLKPQMKLTTNPGGVGHVWVKKRYIDVGEWETPHDVQELDEDERPIYLDGKPVTTRRIFIPAKLADNKYIDEGYEARLQTLDERLRRQLLEGDWDALEGQFFSEFSRAIHVIEPFEISAHWKKYRALDEGYNDPYVCLWIALDEKGNAYVYREFVKRHLLSSEQAQETKALTPLLEHIEYSVGDTSFWNRAKTENVTPADLFAQYGVPLIQAKKERVNGWKRLREWLHVYREIDHVTGEPYLTAKMKIFSTCRNLIEALPAMIIDEHNPEDIEDHPLDHAPDALRYFVMSRPSPNQDKPWAAEPKIDRHNIHFDEDIEDDELNDHGGGFY